MGKSLSSPLQIYTRKFMGLLSKNALVGSVGTYINKDGIVPGYME